MRSDIYIDHDGLPSNKKADPDCQICGGHGIVDETPSGFWLMPILADCKCTKGNKDVPESVQNELDIG